MADGRVQDFHPIDLNNRSGAAGYRKVNGAWEPWDGSTNNKVWDTGSLTWVSMTQPGGTGGGYEVVGLKSSSDVRVNPGTEETLQAILAALGGGTMVWPLPITLLASDPAPQAGKVLFYALTDGVASPNNVITLKYMFPDGSMVTIQELTV